MLEDELVSLLAFLHAAEVLQMRPDEAFLGAISFVYAQVGSTANRVGASATARRRASRASQNERVPVVLELLLDDF